MATGTLVAVGAASFESAVLTAASAGGLHVVRRCVDVADLLATAATRQAEVALVSGALGGLDSEVLARLRDEGVTSLGVVTDESSEEARLLRRLGVDALVTVARLGGLAAAVVELVQREPTHRRSAGPAADEADQGLEPPDLSGKVVAVWGPTGAPGRSTLTLGVAATFAGSGVSTLVVDADVYGGAQAQLLGLLDEASGLLAAARAANRGRLDAVQLAGHARAVSPTLSIVTGLPRADRWVELSPVLLRRILDTARGLAAVTLVDCGFSVELDEELSYDVTAPRRNGATLAALEQADVVLVVGSADPIGLGRLLRAVADLRVQAPDVSPRIVINRVRPSLGWSTEDVAAMVRRTSLLEVEAFLPDDPAACDRALVHGRSLVECAAGSRLTRAIGRLVADLARELELPPLVSGRRAG